MKPEKRFEFHDEGVQIKVPAQKAKIKVVKLPLGKLSELRGAKSDFRPGRLVVNFALVDEEQPDRFLEEFESPFELRVRYTPADQKRAEKAGRPMELAFWDGQDWVRFTQEKHQFKLEPEARPGAGGFGIALISKWGDPQIAWGP